jgi:hypothetical protein
VRGAVRGGILGGSAHDRPARVCGSNSWQLSSSAGEGWVLRTLIDPGWGRVEVTSRGAEEKLARGSRLLARGSGPLARGSGPLARESGPLARGSGPLARGSRPLARGSGPLARGSRALARGSRALARGSRARARPASPPWAHNVPSPGLLGGKPHQPLPREPHTSLTTMATTSGTAPATRCASSRAWGWPPAMANMALPLPVMCTGW